MAFGLGEAIVGDGIVMSATETGIAEDDAADVANAEMAEEVVEETDPEAEAGVG